MTIKVIFEEPRMTKQKKDWYQKDSIQAQTKGDLNNSRRILRERGREIR